MMKTTAKLIAALAFLSCSPPAGVAEAEAKPAKAAARLKAPAPGPAPDCGGIYQPCCTSPARPCQHAFLACQSGRCIDP